MLLEDVSACLCVCISGGDTAALNILNNPVFDRAAGVGVSLLLVEDGVDIGQGQ